MDALIVLNTGSSSMKFSVFSIHKTEMKREYLGSVKDLLDSPQIKITRPSGEIELDKKLDTPKDKPIQKVLHFILDWMHEKNIDIIAAGHRIVHGGKFKSAVVLNEKVVEYLKTLIPFSPLHEPYNLNGYLFFKEEFKDLFQVATFDRRDSYTIVDMADLSGLIASVSTAVLGERTVADTYISNVIAAADEEAAILAAKPYLEL